MKNGSGTKSDKIDPDHITLKDLSKTTNVRSFDCGDHDLNDFLWNDALPHQNIYVSKTRVAYYSGKDKLVSNKDNPYRGEVLGFITLITDNIEKKMTKVDEDYRYRYYPALKIARLGVNCDYKHKGIGSAMIYEALLSAVSIYHVCHSGCRLVTVDAKTTQEAVDFYTSFGFQKARRLDAGHDTIPMYLDYAAYLGLIK